MNKKGLESFQGYIVAVLLVGLFIVSIYTFSVKIGDNYDKNLTIDSSQIDLVELQDQINSTSTSARNWEKSITSDNIFISSGAIILFSLWGIFKLMWTSFNAFTTIYYEGMNNVLGIDPMVTGVLSAILIIGLIFAIWRAIKTGD